LTTSLFEQVQSYIQSRTLVQPDDRILVGVSGGPDSTALLHLLHRLASRWSITLGVVHFDHCLRGAASGADARWVADLAASLGLPCYSGKGDVRSYKASHKISLQTAARELRQQFFQEIRQKHGYRLLALGHTADDQVELFFLRLLRGAGPEGLKGMWPNSQGIIRPLLETSKSRIVHWLESEGLSYRLDDSNESRRYRRNQLRLDLLPQLEKYNPRFGEAVRRFQALLQEQEDYLHQEASRILADLMAAPDVIPAVLPLKPFLDLHPSLQKRVFRLASAKAGVPLEGLTSRQVSAALHLCRSSRPTGKISLPGNWHLVKENHLVSWRRRPSAPPPLGAEYTIVEPTGAGAFLGWTFTWTVLLAPAEETIISDSPETVCMDYDKLRWPLRFRTFRPGDRFQPLGMSGTKKLQDFFIDAKIPRWRRLFIPLLLSGDEIIWLAGQRLAEPVKVTPQTRRLFKLQAIPPSEEIASRAL
jgi:tRNA(Ile)-lysidine synthase